LDPISDIYTMLQVTCAIIINEGKVLVTQRNEQMKLPLKWEFPGGKIENGESASDCLLREIAEELNIQISIERQLPAHIYNYGSFVINLIPFVARLASGQLVLREHLDSAWLAPAQLLDLDWAPADIPIVRDFLQLYSHAATL